MQDFQILKVKDNLKDKLKFSFTNKSFFFFGINYEYIYKKKKIFFFSKNPTKQMH